ncbi:hypothetical protein PN498_15395, partial [Oscillatoria sp. CS-180]|uniref:hypothetical protein n=1 Tax=Oscillatoria sp. CS-180 TaxID=3021720 RepID=UPI003FA7D774|nr:hypothetical protein [Oscillatoria sp. CS-180]
PDPDPDPTPDPDPDPTPDPDPVSDSTGDESITLAAKGKYLDGDTTAQQWSDDVTISGVSADGTAAAVKHRNGGFSVKGGRYDSQIDYDPSSDKGERLVIDFENGAEQATVTLGKMNANETDGLPETGRWIAYDEEGEEISSGALDPTQTTAISKDTYSFDISTSETFSRLAIEATAYGNGEGTDQTDNNSDFNLKAVTYVSGDLDSIDSDPVTEDPVVEDPVVEEPVTEDPATEEPVAEEPVAEDPASQQWSDDVTISGVSADGTAAAVEHRNGGFSVKGGRYDSQIDYDPISGKSERLLIDFENGAEQATVTLGKMNANETDGLPETGRWIAYDEEGDEISSGALDPTQTTAISKDTYSFDISTSETFSRLAIEATAYGNGEGTDQTDNNSDFSLKDVIYIPGDLDSTDSDRADEEPVDEEPVDEEPVVEEPVAEEPVDEEPVVEEPVVEEPVAEDPVFEPTGDPNTITVNKRTFDDDLAATQEWEDGVTVTAYDIEGNVSFIEYRSTNPAGNPQKEDGIGVNGDGGRNDYQIDYVRDEDASEKMVVDFDGGVTDVTFEVGHLGGTEGPDGLPETGTWKALGDEGQVVSTGLIGPEESIDGLISGSYGRYEFEVTADEPIHQLVLEATDFGYGEEDLDLTDVAQKGTNSSEYTLRSITYTRVEEDDTLTGMAESSSLVGDFTDDPITNFSSKSSTITTDDSAVSGSGDDTQPLEMNTLAAVDMTDTTELGSGDFSDTSEETNPFGDGLNVDSRTFETTSFTETQTF